MELSSVLRVDRWSTLGNSEGIGTKADRGDIMAIDEDRTMQLFGYTSDALLSGSAKKVISVCEGCGVYRVVQMRQSGYLCRSCSAKNAATSPTLIEKRRMNTRNMWKDADYRNNQLEKTTKRYEDPTVHRKMSVAGKKRCAAQTVREKMSIAATKMWEDSNYRDNQKGVQSARCADPVVREKMSAIQQGIPYDEWETFSRDSPYCPKFNEACRESNREKYDRRCFLSATTEDDNRQKLSVHHVDMNKNQGCDGTDWRLVPLSKKWHAKSHNPTWVARIVYLLEHVWNPGRNNVVS